MAELKPDLLVVAQKMPDCSFRGFMQHIHQWFSQKQIAPVTEQLQTRVAELEAEVEPLRSSVRPNNEQ